VRAYSKAIGPLWNLLADSHMVEFMFDPSEVLFLGANNLNQDGRISSISGGLMPLTSKKYWGVLGVIFLAIILLTAGLSEEDLTLDNVYYAATSKSVLVSENPLILSVAGQSYFKKPPLFFWLNSLFLFLFGYHAWSAMMLSIVFGILSLLMVYLFSLSVTRDVDMGAASVFAMLTTYTFFRNAKACRMETMLLFLILLSVWHAVRFIKTGQPRHLYIWATLAGLAVLTKGIAGVLPFLTGVLFFGINRKRQRGFRKHNMLLAFLLFTSVFGWWYVYIGAQPGFWKTFLNQEILQRMGMIAGPGHIHFSRDPVYTFVWDFLKDYFLYIPLLVYGWYCWKDDRPGSLEIQALTILAILQLVSIHFVGTKYARYLLPVYPVCAVFAGIGAIRLSRFVTRSTIVIFAITSLLVVTFWPVPLGRNDYRILDRINKNAHQEGVVLVVDPRYYAYWENKAAVFFFLDHYQVAQKDMKDLSPSYYVTSPGLSAPDNLFLLVQTRKVAVYQVR
jgi:4-amino-4-deoxy-L-arabinose transferase-like glycosyltransferase